MTGLCYDGRSCMSESDVNTAQAATEPSPARAAAVPTRRGPSTRQIAIVVAILGGGVLFTAMTSDVTKVSEPGVKLTPDRKSTRLNSSHLGISYAVFCL